MAKPGSEQARELAQMSRQAKLVSAGLPPQIEAALLQKIEGQLGMRCGGCHRRVTIGIQFTKLGIRIGEHGGPEADVMKLTACSRDDCDFAHEAMEGATAMEMIEYKWLDDKDLDAVVLPEDAAAGPGLDPDPDAHEPKNG